MVNNRFSIERSKKSPTRKVPFFPRFGFVIEIGGRRISYRHVPLTETLLNLLERGPSSANLHKIVTEQFAEIVFPSKRKTQTLTVKSKTIEARQ